MAYENEDGDAWVEVSLAPDLADAGQRYADQSGLGVIAAGRERTNVQDCECPRPQRHCPDDEARKRCRFRKAVDCWRFFMVDADQLPDEADGEQFWYPRDEDGRAMPLGHKYGPGCAKGTWCRHTPQGHQLEPFVAPGQVEAFGEVVS
jgi:hypothetical protein